MRKMSFVGLCAIVLLGSLSLPALAGVTVGEMAPDFRVADTEGNEHQLSDYRGKYVVLEWTNYECPFVVKHYGSGNMQSLQAEYAAKGVVWFSVGSSAPGKQGYFTAEQWNAKVKQKGVKASAILLDSDGEMGRLYGAKTTPHMFIIHPEGNLIYQGAIDDIPSTDAADIANAKNYVRNALQSSIAGNPVVEQATKAYGCSVKYEI